MSIRYRFIVLFFLPIAAVDLYFPMLLPMRMSPYYQKFCALSYDIVRNYYQIY